MFEEIYSHCVQYRACFLNSIWLRTPHCHLKLCRDETNLILSCREPIIQIQTLLFFTCLHACFLLPKIHNEGVFKYYVSNVLTKPKMLMMLL